MRGLAYLEHFQQAQIPASLAILSPGPMAWQAPSLGTVKVNVDVGLARNSMNAWVAMVARNDAGDCLWWSKKMIVGRPSPVDGEALAILHGLTVARAHGWTNVVMESDCLQLVNVLSSQSGSMASFGAIVDACLGFYDCFQALSFSFIRRSGNSLAHRLATSAEGSSLPPEVVSGYE